MKEGQTYDLETTHAWEYRFPYGNMEKGEKVPLTITLPKIKCDLNVKENWECPARADVLTISHEGKPETAGGYTKQMEGLYQTRTTGRESAKQGRLEADRDRQVRRFLYKSEEGKFVFRKV